MEHYFLAEMRQGGPSLALSIFLRENTSMKAVAVHYMLPSTFSCSWSLHTFFALFNPLSPALCLNPFLLFVFAERWLNFKTNLKHFLYHFCFKGSIKYF